MAYPKINGDPELLKITIKDNQLKELQYKTAKRDFENKLNSPKIGSVHYKTKKQFE